MKKLVLRIFRIVFWFVLLSGSLRSHAIALLESKEEVSFDDLVRELNTKAVRQERIRSQTNLVDPYEQLRIHTSMGFIQSLNTFLIGDQYIHRFEDGFQLGLGIDLFSSDWVAEGVLKNFGQSRQSDTTLALREFDLRLSYASLKNPTHSRLRIVNGLGARYLKISSAVFGLSERQTTPVYVAGLGFLVPMSSQLEIDFEIQGHLSLVSDTLDRHGLSLLIRLDTIF